MKILDLCSGLGGFSEAFLQRGHSVFRIDNDPRFSKVPYTEIFDIRHISKTSFPCLDLLLISPPCTNFSLASSYIHWNKKRPADQQTIDDIGLVMFCLDLVKELDPGFWILENPVGMLRQILNIPGEVLPGVTTWLGAWGTPNLKPTDLWGKLPPMDWPAKPDMPKGAGCGKRGGKDLRPTDPAERAKIPFDLSLALCLAMEKTYPGAD